MGKRGGNRWGGWGLGPYVRVGASRGWWMWGRGRVSEEVGGLGGGERRGVCHGL